MLVQKEGINDEAGLVTYSSVIVVSAVTVSVTTVPDSTVVTNETVSTTVLKTVDGVGVTVVV